MPAVEPLEPTDPPSIGAHRLTGRLGQGGQAVVYLAQSESGDQVAIKLFQTPLDGDPALRNGIIRELETARQVARFCTAQVLDSGMVGNRPYIVSEYVAGPSLQQVVTDSGPVSGSALDRLAIGTATALVALHDAGIVHCDFKPGNVLLGPDGWRVIDFGISRMNTGTQTLASKVTGTPAFMAPEQLAGEPLGPPVDVFAWASTMAFAAAGSPPFGNDTIPAVMNRISHFAPDLSGIEEPLRSLLADCLVKEPAQRPSAARILDRLVRRGGDVTGAHPGDGAGFGPGNGFVFVPGVGLVPGEGFGTPDAAGSAGSPAPPHPPAAAPAPVEAARPAPAPANVSGGGPDRPTIPNAPPSHLAAAAPAGGGHSGRTATGSRRGTRLLLGAGVAAVLAAVGVTAVWLLPSAGSTKEAASGASPNAAVTAAASTAPGPARPTRRSATATPGRTTPGATPSPRRSTPGVSKAPSQRSAPPTLRRVELGQGHFSGYCTALGWEWGVYRETPKPGFYCVRRSGASTYLTAEQRDAGCRWRFDNPRARHYFKSKTNYCYAYQ